MRLYKGYLWTSLLLPVLTWLAQISVSHLVITYACHQGRLWLLHGISIACFLPALVGVILGVKSWRYFSKGSLPGHTFMSFCSVVLGFIFLLSIVVAEFANILMEPCR